MRTPIIPPPRLDSDTVPLPVQTIKEMCRLHGLGLATEVCRVCGGRPLAANDAADEACGGCAGRGFVEISADDSIPPPPEAA